MILKKLKRKKKKKKEINTPKIFETEWADENYHEPESGLFDPHKMTGPAEYMREKLTRH
jgi:hypothetical protein